MGRNLLGQQSYSGSGSYTRSTSSSGGFTDRHGSLSEAGGYGTTSLYHHD